MTLMTQRDMAEALDLNQAYISNALRPLKPAERQGRTYLYDPEKAAPLIEDYFRRFARDARVRAGVWEKRVKRAREMGNRAT